MLYTIMFLLRRSAGSCRFLLHKAQQCRSLSIARLPFLKIHEEVQEAVRTGKPVVALETTIYTHGKFDVKLCSSTRLIRRQDTHTRTMSRSRHVSSRSFASMVLSQPR